MICLCCTQGKIVRTLSSKIQNLVSVGTTENYRDNLLQVEIYFEEFNYKRISEYPAYLVRNVFVDSGFIGLYFTAHWINMHWSLQFRWLLFQWHVLFLLNKSCPSLARMYEKKYFTFAARVICVWHRRDSWTMAGILCTLHLWILWVVSFT